MKWSINISIQIVDSGRCYIMNVPSSIPRLKLVSYSLSHLFSLHVPVNKESYPKVEALILCMYASANLERTI